MREIPLIYLGIGHGLARVARAMLGNATLLLLGSVMELAVSVCST